MSAQQDINPAEEFVPSEATLQLFDRYCGLKPDEVVQRALEAHQAGITRGFPFLCVRKFRFMEPRIANHPLFDPQLAPPPTSDASALADRKLLDIGCCMGTDIRYLLSTKTWTAEQVLGVDLLPEFIDIGLDVLYKDRDRMQHAFLTGNVLDKESPIWTDSRFQAKFDIVYTGSVLHLLLEDAVEQLVSTVFERLLKPGGTFCGRSAGWSDTAHSEGHLFSGEQAQLKFLYPPAALKRLLEKHGLQNVEVHVDVNEVNLPREEMRDIITMMNFQGTKPA